MNNKLTAFYLSIIVLIGFTVYFIFKGNYEFLAYTVSIGVLIGFLMWSDRYLSYLSIAKWGFLIWLILHLLGGSVYISGVRLYDTILLNVFGEPFNILRYDQFVHSFCYVVFSFFVYSVVVYVTENKINNTKKHKFLMFLIVFLASMGIGAVNEIIEFATVAFFGSTGVGNYYNNALDLVFNAVGILIGIFILSLRKKYEKE